MKLKNNRFKFISKKLHSLMLTFTMLVTMLFSPSFGTPHLVAASNPAEHDVENIEKTYETPTDLVPSVVTPDTMRVELMNTNQLDPPTLSNTSESFGSLLFIDYYGNDEWAAYINKVAVKSSSGNEIILEQDDDYGVDPSMYWILIDTYVFGGVGNYTITFSSLGYEDASVIVTINKGQPIALAADTTDSYDGQPIEITFTNNIKWVDFITEIKVNGQLVANSDYTVDKASGKITISPSVFTPGDINDIEVLANNYEISTVEQMINPLKTPPTVNPDISENYLLNPLELTFTPDNEWVDVISEITVQEQYKGIEFTLSKEKYEVDKTTNTIKIASGSFSETGYYKITISAAGYSDAYFWQNVSLKAPPIVKPDTTNNEYLNPLELPYTDDGMWSDLITSISATNTKTENKITLSASDYTVDKVSGNIIINSGVLTIGDYIIRIVAPNYIDSQVYQVVKEISAIILTADTTENDPVHDLELTFTDDGNWAKSITGIKAKNVITTVETLLEEGKDYSIDEASGKIVIKAGVVAPGTYDLIVTAPNYADSVVRQTITAITPPAVQADTTHNGKSTPIELTFTDDGFCADAITEITFARPVSNPISMTQDQYKIDKDAGTITINPGVFPYDETYWITIIATNYTNVSLQQVIKTSLPPTVEAAQTEMDRNTPLVLQFDNDGYWADAITSVRVTNPDSTVTNLVINEDFTINKQAGTITINAGILKRGNSNISIYATNYFVKDVRGIYVTDIKPPTITADSTDNTILNSLELTFTDDGQWADAITEISILDGWVPIIIPENQYEINREKGIIRIHAGILPAGTSTIIVKATDYEEARIDQEVTDILLLNDVKVNNRSVDYEINRNNYKTIVKHNVGSVKVTPVSINPNYTIMVNGQTVSSGQESLDIQLANIFPDVNTIDITVTAEEGLITGEYQLDVYRAMFIEVTDASKRLPLIGPTSMLIPETVSEVKISLIPQDNGNGGKESDIMMDAQVQTSIGSILLEIPAGKVTGPANWNGEILLPTVRENNSVTEPGDSTIHAVVEVGMTDSSLQFEKAVKIVLPNQAGKSAGYIDHEGSFKKIDTKLEPCNQLSADALPQGGDAYCMEGSNLVIWTKHLTKFVSYTETSDPKDPDDSNPPPVDGETDSKDPDDSDPPTGGGGGGSATTANSANEKPITASIGGTFENEGAKVVIPANAHSTNFRIVINKVEHTANLPFGENRQRMSEVYEITKDQVGQFNRHVTITLPFDKAKYNPATHELSIFWFNEAEKEWIELENVEVDLNSGKVSGQVNHFTKFALLATEKVEKQAQETSEEENQSNEGQTAEQFADINNHWASKEIQALVSKGAVNGFPDGTFKPNNNISRAEFASILVKSLGLTCEEGKVFSDTANHWAKDCISAAATNGLVVGLETDRFAPNEPITREQMAVIIARAAKLTLSEAKTAFIDDAQISSWAKTSVAAAAAQNLVGGMPDGSFNPKVNATRAEAAAILTRLIK